ncbi:MAG: ABC transporter substrate-binding protein [Desulfobacterales bacterium]|nr:ABC transporter substrate-binding protein [Desulfobacterales bacterium]MBF0396207.1 ABC transporter substrate-binding protein [Desulfobacterales bacterium]
MILIAGCSDEPKSSVSSEPSVKKVSLQLQWVTQAQFAGYYVALEKGWFKEEGIELAIKPGGPDIIPVDLVTSGTRDFGTALLSDLVVAIQNGKTVISIAQIQQVNGLLLIAKKSSGIKEPKDFIGKRVGIWFQGFEAQYNALLAKDKISEKDIKIVSQGWGMEPFLKGDIDVASAMIYNEYHVVLESGIKHEDINVIDYRTYGLDFPGDTLFTSRKTAMENSDLCIKMLRASIKGWQYAIKHPEESVDIVLKYDTSGIQKRSHQLVMMQEIAKLVQVIDKPIGQTDRNAVLKMVETLLHHKILKKAIGFEDICISSISEKAIQKK